MTIRTMTTSHAGSRPGLPGRLSAMLSRFAKAHRDRKDMIRLMELDDHMLADLGLDRADVERAVRDRQL
jgi:uncharacterized protein YjiS (DUF1127 family)